MGDSNQAAITLLEGVTMHADIQAKLAADVVDLYRQTAPASCALASPRQRSRISECPLVRNQLCTAGRNAALLYRGMHREADAAAVASTAIGSLGCAPEMFR